MRTILVLSLSALALLGVGVALITLGASSGACPAIVCISNQVLVGYLLLAVGTLVGIVVALRAIVAARWQADGITLGALALADLASVFVVVSVVVFRHLPQPPLGAVALLTAAVAPPLAALLYSLLAKQRVPRIAAISALAVVAFVMALAAALPWAGS